jgi:hypothetical protein
MTLQKIWSESEAESPAVRVVSVLRADPDLAPGIAPDRRMEARRRSAARLWRADVPQLEREEALDGETGYGLLVLSGVLCRRVFQEGGIGAELVGPGDLIRPWEQSADWPSAPGDCRWTVVKPADLAVLDRAFARRVAPFPEIAIGLNRRAVCRAARLAIMLGSLGQPRVEDRLTRLFEHLAERFGRMRAGTIHVPLPLTHELLAELVAARRPSVTKALAVLREDEVLVREGEGWLLRCQSLTPCV